MVLGTLLLISLLECFSFKVEVKVKLLPDIDRKEGIISKDWKHSIPNNNCSVSSWEASKGQAATCIIGSSLSENCTLVSPEYDVTKGKTRLSKRVESGGLLSKRFVSKPGFGAGKKHIVIRRRLSK